MTNNLEIAKINAVVDLLIESDVDLSNALGKDGLIVCLLGDCVKLRIRSKYQNLILYFMQFADPFSVRAGRRTANWTKARQQYNQI